MKIRIIIGLICMNFSLMNLQAELPSLDKISESIKTGNTSEVKTLWKRIERHATLEEQRTALTKLIDEASELSDEHKKATSSSGIQYKKVIPGTLLTATGFGIIGYCIKWQYFDRNLYRHDLPAYYALIGLAAALNAGGRYLISSGWKTSAGKGGESSEWAKIVSYLEKQLDDVKDQLKNRVG